MEPPLHKYTRPDGSTPTYNMDTDISTLEAPTFTTLSHGPSVNVLQALKWDHQPTLIGTKVVNPILHVCDKCQHPIIRYGRLNCKHVLCHSCASGLLKEISNCIRCNTKVTGVEEVGLGRLFVCSYGGSRLVMTGSGTRKLRVLTLKKVPGGQRILAKPAPQKWDEDKIAQGFSQFSTL